MINSRCILAEYATPDGGLWIGFRPGGVSFVRNGRVAHYGESDGMPAGTVQQLVYGSDGSLWAVARSGVAHFDGKRWEAVKDEPRLNRVYGVILDRAGTLWFATAQGLLARTMGERGFREFDRRDYSDPRGGPLAAAPDGTVWAIAPMTIGHYT